MQRRLAWRNERNLYKRKCNAEGHSEILISMYSPTVNTPVYDQKYWHGDGWDPIAYAKSIDFSEPFLTQWYKLFLLVPTPALINLNDVNSDYCNFTYQSKNCYLNFASDINQDTAYLYHSIENRKCFDMLGSRKNENCYELVDSEKCYGSDNLILCEECIDSKFCLDCRNCQNCIGCFGLRNAKYCVFNKQLSKEEYEQILEKIKLKEERTKIEKEFLGLTKFYPRKFFNSKQAINSTGDYLNHVKNCKYCFDIEGPAEDLKYVSYGVTDMRNVKDSYAIGVNIENSYDVMDTGDNVSNAAFSANVWNSYDIRYGYFLKNCKDCFGCVGLRNKQYCILNKQYSKEEYGELLPRIIKHMNDLPYVDKKGRVYKYGEFFPIEMSPFSYNESIAQEYYPLTKDHVIKKGFSWNEKEKKNYDAEIDSYDLGEIKNIEEGIVGKLLSCAHAGGCNEQCVGVFKIIEEELKFYKNYHIPIPELCPNCRHHQRLKKRNPFKLWHRSCMCDKENHFHGVGKCKVEFETSYAPDRPEIVYCEKCYQAEVY